MTDEEKPAEEAAPTEEQAAEGGQDLGLNQLEDEAGAPEDGDDEFETTAKNATDLAAVYDIPVQVSAVLGKSSMPVSQLLKLGRGAVVELDRKVGEPIDIFVNNRLVARGEVMIVDERLGVTLTEIIKSDQG